MEVLKKYPTFESQVVADKTVLSIPRLMVYLERRKVYCAGKEISLTAKEYDILCLLMENIGRVLTYGQIYQNVWGGETLGNENNIIGCHIRRMRGKLTVKKERLPFIIKCVREVGYCFEMNPQY
ncbi:MAG: winged helix-turn-helix domain-containing protein [Muribaculaceae bacterium]|nr:winged helix-turn-helix domain-containing protein [Muribaculaceae bacterium]